MVLGADQIIARIRDKVRVLDREGRSAEKPLIEGLGDEQIDKIEGTTVDLRLDVACRLEGEARPHQRVTPETEEVLGPHTADGYTIAPGEYLLVQTAETVNLPGDLIADLRTRSTLFRCGIILKTTYVSPNYQGKLWAGMHNAGPCPVHLDRGVRFACIAFHQVEGETVPYQGVWQDGRGSTEGEVERPF
jgi:deoxycytidine triphosphate deaminase